MDLPESNSPPLAPPTERFPPAPLTPPTEQGGIAITGPRSFWPNVLGTLCIIWGCCAMIYHAASVFEPEMRRSPTSGWIVASVAESLLGAALFAGGIALARRARSSIKTLRVWACLKIGVTTSLLIFAQLVIIGVNSSPSRPSDFDRTALGLTINLVWTWLLPVFLLVWLRRPSIRTETTAWNRPHAQRPTP